MWSSIVCVVTLASPAFAFVSPSWSVDTFGGSSARPLRMAADIAPPLGVGVIGCGRIGEIHSNTLAFRTPGARLIAVSDVFEEAGERVVKKCGGIPKYYKDWKEMVHDPEVQAIVIGSPTPYHAEQITEAAKWKKHIFCEKPISFDLDTIDACTKDVEDNGVKLLLGFQRRFDSNFRAVKDGIRSGAIGEVRTFHITSRDPAPPPIDYLKKSGGIFMDMTSHDFDMARFLVDSELEEVYVQAAAFDSEAKEAADYDTVVTTLKFKNGAFGTIENSRRCSFGYDQRVEVFGQKGTINGQNRGPAAVEVCGEDGCTTGLPYSFFMDRYAEAYVNIMGAFVKYVTSDDPDELKAIQPALAYDGKVCILAGMAALKSAKEGRPVKISEVA